MRRTHLRGHENILKRLLIHASGFNFGLLLRGIFGVGTARGFLDLANRVFAAPCEAIELAIALITVPATIDRAIPSSSESDRISLSSPFVDTEMVSYTTGC
jgi:transposase